MIMKKESQKGRRGSRGASESTNEKSSVPGMIHTADWNLTETTRGQCSKHKGDGNRKKTKKEEEVGTKKEQPLLSALRFLPLCLGKDKGDG